MRLLLTLAAAVALTCAHCAKNTAPPPAIPPPAAPPAAGPAVEEQGEEDNTGQETLLPVSRELKSATLRLAAFGQGYSRSREYKDEAKSRPCGREEKVYRQSAELAENRISDLRLLLSGKRAPKKERVEEQFRAIDAAITEAGKTLEGLLACQRLELRILDAGGKVLFQTKRYAGEAKGAP
ncbi:hypothetical protein EPN90_04345 [Patescibacteria group bacterium]|nr:MAG: hypothetical protein EPN90_04345 [Patescibacteria group bacterium]